MIDMCARCGRPFTHHLGVRVNFCRECAEHEFGARAVAKAHEPSQRQQSKVMTTKSAREAAAKAIDVGIPGVFRWIETGDWHESMFTTGETQATHRMCERVAMAIQESAEHALSMMPSVAGNYRRDLEFVNHVEHVADLVRKRLGLLGEGDANG